jgi:AAA domain
MLPSYDETYPDGRDGSAAAMFHRDGTDPGDAAEGIPTRRSPSSPAEYDIRYVRGADLLTRQVRWAWSGRMPAATVVIVEGDPDCGKSTIASTILAALTVGLRLPDSRDDALSAFDGPVSVGYITGEDAPETTNLPRFLAAGGDPARIAFYRDVALRDASDDAQAELLSLPRHVAELRAWIEELDMKALVIDVLSSFTGERIDSHNDASVRRMLTPLKEIAEATGCLIIVIRHLTKGRGGRAIYAGQGSIAYGAAARSVLTAAIHPNDPDVFVLAVTKGNLAPKDWRATLAYRLHSVPFDFDDETVGTVAKVEWLGVVEITADEAVSPTSEDDRSALDDAAEWLVEFLTDSPKHSMEIRRSGREDGHSWATLRRAAKNLKVQKRKVGRPGEQQHWEWALAEGAHATSKMPSGESLSTLNIFGQASEDAKYPTTRVDRTED